MFTSIGRVAGTVKLQKKVKEYVANLKKKECKGKMKIYSVILYTEEEKPGEEVYIYRAYQGEDGHGRRGTFM